MTASLRGLIACSALVIALALAWVLGAGGAPRQASPQVLAVLPAQVQELRWRRDGRDELVVRRQREGWTVTSSATVVPGATVTPGAPAPSVPVRAEVIEDLLDVVAAARWHRRAEPARAGRVERELVIDGVALGLGAPLDEQRWLLVRGHALLVDGWVARVLEADPERILDRAALSGAVRSKVLEVHGHDAPWETTDLVVQGVQMITPQRRLVDPALQRLLYKQLSELQLMPAPAMLDEQVVQEGDDEPRWSLRLAGGPTGEAKLTAWGPCPPGSGSGSKATHVLSSRLGSGCIDDASLLEVASLLDRFASPEGAEGRPFAADAADIVEWSVASPDEQTILRLTRDGGRWQGRRESASPSPSSLATAPFAVEDSAVERALALLTLPWVVRPFSAVPSLRQLAPGALPASATPRLPGLLARLTARQRDGTIVALHALGAGAGAGMRRWVVRGGERIALEVPSWVEVDALALVASLAALSLWQLEPTAVERLILDGRALRRGAVLGEWQDAGGQPLPAVVSAQAEALVAALAGLRAVSRQPHGAAAVHRLELVLAADPARTATATERHLLELTSRAGECLGRADGAEARFDPALCTQVAALRSR